MYKDGETKAGDREGRRHERKTRETRVRETDGGDRMREKETVRGGRQEEGRMRERQRGGRPKQRVM